MFSNLLFLVLVLLITTMGETAIAGVALAPSLAFVCGVGVFVLVLAGIALQNRLCRKRWDFASHTLVFISSIELVVGVALFYLVFGGQRLFDGIPLGVQGTVNAVFALLLYFSGLAVIYWTTYDPRANVGDSVSQKEHVALQLRFMAPFTVPFLFFTFLGDFASLLPLGKMSRMVGSSAEGLTEWVGTFGITGLFLVGMMIFLPYIITSVWQCTPMPPGPLTDRLNALCKRLKFRHAGMMTWTVMRESMTAAIIGVVSRFRYVMFTPALLEQMSPESVEAVLAHEIGHSQRKHLLIYPLVIFGAMVILGFYAALLALPIDNFFALKQLLHPGVFWGLAQPLAMLLPYVLILALYARVVFGFFSRQFERQADLHVYEAGLSPQAMINALDDVAVVSGNIHTQPNWHHYSIKQRIDFLRATETKPSLINKHHWRVRAIVAAYLALLAVGASLILDISGEGTPRWKTPAQWISRTYHDVDTALNGSMRQELALRYAETSGLGESPRAIKALERSLRKSSAVHYPGVVQYYAAQMLLDAGEPRASAQMMAAAWHAFDFEQTDPGAQDEFVQLSQRILWAVKVARIHTDVEAENLRSAMQRRNSP